MRADGIELMNMREPTPDPAKGWRPMTELEAAAAVALSAGVVYPVASAPKRLARSLHHQATGSKMITPGQVVAMWNQVHRFHRQIADKKVLREAEKLLGPFKSKGK